MNERRVVVPAADFIRNIGYWQKEALRQPISITHHGRESLVLAAPGDLAAREQEGSVKDPQWRAAYALMLDNISEGYVAFDQDLRIVAVNHVAESFIGRLRDDLKGQLIASALPNLIASALAERAQRALMARMPESFEIEGRGGLHLAVRVYPCGDGVVALFTNLSEVWALRRAIEDSKGLDLAARNHTGLTSFKLDTRARIEAVSPAFADWSGFEPEHIIGHRLFDLVPGASRKEAAQAFEAVMRNGEAVQMQLPLLNKSGAATDGSVSIAPVMTDFTARAAQAVWIADSEPKRAQ